MRNGHVDKGGELGGGGSPWRASRGPRAPGPRDHGESGRGERARQAPCPLLPGWALNPGRGRRAGERECVSLSSFTAEQPARAPRRRRVLGATVAPPTSSSFCSSILLPPHTSMGSRPPCRHLLSARPRRHQLPPPWPRAARAPGVPAPGVVPRSRRPQPLLARRSARPN